MRTRIILTVIALLIAPVALAGCVQEAPLDAQSGGTPDLPSEASATASSWARELPAVIKGLSHVTTVEDVEAAAGLWTHGDHAYVGGQGGGLYVVNLTTPTAPTVVGHLSGFYARDADLLHYPNRTVAVLAGSGGGMHLVDVTTPSNPEMLATVDVSPVHNVAVVPGTHIVYNSRSLSTQQVVDVVDASDPANPEVLREIDFTTTCHDVAFADTDEGPRAYCAAVEQTQIWDITDPVHPTLVSRIVNPAINIHHVVVPAHDGELLIIGDEYAGSTTASTGCLANAGDPAGTGDVSDPVGAAWFYDTSDETNPTPLSWISPPAPTDNLPMTPCTAHFGTLVEDRDKLVMGWRYTGTHLIDFQDPTAPRILDTFQGASNVWDARVHNGYVFTGDEQTGMDVLTFTSIGT